jgi:hypothetical protein
MHLYAPGCAFMHQVAGMTAALSGPFGACMRLNAWLLNNREGGKVFHKQLLYIAVRQPPL